MHPYRCHFTTYCYYIKQRYTHKKQNTYNHGWSQISFFQLWK